MASKTQLRLSQLTGSIGSGTGQINDSTSASATPVLNDLSGVLSHMASSIKRIHGGSTFAEQAAGIFAQNIAPDVNGTRVLGGNIAATFNSSVDVLSGGSIDTSSKIVRFSSIGSISDAKTNDFLAMGSFRATLAADPSTTVTFASGFASSLDTSAMGSTLNSSTSTIPFSSASALVAALGTDIRSGDVLVIGDANFTVSSTYSSGASVAVSHTSGTQSVSGISSLSSGALTLSAAGSGDSLGGLAVSPVAGSVSASGLSSAATAIVRGYSMVRANNLEMNGAGRIDLDLDQDTSIRSSTDDQIDFEVGGSDVVRITSSVMDINGLELILDADADTSIHASTDDQVDFKIAGSDELHLTSAALYPEADAGLDLGLSAQGFNDVHLSNGSVISYGAGGQTITHTETSTEGSDVKSSAGVSQYSPLIAVGSADAGTLDTDLTALNFFALGSDVKSTYGPAIDSSTVFNGSLSGALQFIGLGASIHGDHAGNIDGSYIGEFDSSITFDSNSNAAAFNSATGSGTVVRFTTSSTIYDITVGSYSSGASVPVSIQPVSDGSSLEVSGITAMQIVDTSSSGGGATAAANFYSNVLGSSGGETVRFDDNSSATIDITFGSYMGSGSTISIISVAMVRGSTVSKSAFLNSSGGGSIKAKATSGSSVQSAASAFAQAIGADSAAGVVARFAASSNVIDYTFAQYSSSATSISITGQSQTSGSSIQIADLGSFGTIKVIGQTDDIAITDVLNVSEHNGSDKGLKLGGTLVTSTAAELNLLDGVSGLEKADFTKLAAVTATAAELNYLDNDDLTAADLTKLAALTATAAEINYLDNDALTADDITKLAAINSTAAEINLLNGVSGLVQADFTKLAGVSASAAELNYLDGADSSINSLALPDNTTISAYGATLVDDADAAAARTTLGLGTAAVENLSAMPAMTMASGQAFTLAGVPSSDLHAATKGYVDGLVEGISAKTSVVAASTGNISSLSSGLANGDSLDGVTLATNDRILLKDQSDASENGIYVVASSGAPARADDLASGADAAGVFVFIESGSSNADTGFLCSSDKGSASVGSDNLTFVQFSAAGQVSGGDGIDKSGLVLSVDRKSNGGLVIESSQLAVDLGASSITGTLAIADGGTGATSIAAAQQALDLEPGVDVEPHSDKLTELATMVQATADALADLTAAEVQILDDATVTTAELNLLDGGTSVGSAVGNLASTDGIIINDGGTTKLLPLSDLETFMEANLDTMGSQFTSAASLATVGTLNSGAISSGFGNIDNGSSTLNTGAATVDSLNASSGGITNAGSIAGASSIDGTGDLTMGTITMTGFAVDADGDIAAKSLAVDDGSTIGCDSDADLLTLASASLTAKGAVTVGVDDSGHDVRFYGATSGKSLLWDESEDSLVITGDAVDALKVAGGVDIDGVMNVGVDDTGYDVKFFGDTASAYMLWDASADDLILGGAAGLIVPEGQLTLGSTAVAATATELNMLDAGVAGGSVALADGDAFIIGDADASNETKKVLLSDLKTYVGGGRSKKSVSIGVGGASANSKVDITGAANDGGADPDLTDIYLNGQLMLSGSSASDGDYKIHGHLSSESLATAMTPTAPSSFSAGSATITVPTLSAANAQRLAPGSKITLSNSGSSAVAVLTVVSEPASGATSVSVTVTMSAGSSLALSDVSTKTFEESFGNGVVFFFALERDDVVTSITI